MSETARLIRDSAAAIATTDLKRIRAQRFTRTGFDPAVWREMAELGWPDLRVADSEFGMDAYCALAEELGAALVPEPLIASVTATSVLGSDTRVIIPAWQERANSLDTAGDTLIADGVVRGRKMFVPMAAGADAFLVSGRDGMAVVDANAPGVEITIEQTQDGGHFGTLRLHDAPGVVVQGALASALEEATLATSAYLLGVMERAFALTLDHLRTRQQFGKPIGSFQALQHRAADLKILIALTRASVDHAAGVLDGGADLWQRQAAVSQAKARASEAAMRVTREAIQLHGGVGYTDEYDVGLYLRKAMVLANLHGSAALHRARYAKLMPDEEAA